MKKQVNLLYFSPTGTTEKIVKAAGGKISDSVKEYNITLPKSRESKLSFTKDDLVIIGVPVYSGRIPALIEDFFKNISGNDTLAVLTAVYGHREYDDALLELKNIFKSKGFIPIAAAAFLGEHSFTDKLAGGRPDNNDIKIAEGFGKAVKDKLDKINDISDISPFSIKGNFPYRERKASNPMPPSTNNECVSCGICANSCPTGAIDFDDYSNINENKCVTCCSCIKRCPAGAKSIQAEAYKKASAWLIENFSAVRKEPEIFI